jgi:serine/threonine protein kinase
MMAGANMLICGRYEATGNMNAGGMSEAHECQDVRLQRKVILKTLRKAHEQRRLADERKALLKLRSNHVVQLLDVIEFENLGAKYPCLVLEYIDGNDLAEGSFDVGSGYLAVIWQVAKGLAEIHGQGIVHRDIKPDNVRLDKEGVVKIIDFGLSREIGVDNETQSAFGHLPYMAPELLGKPPLVFTTSADVFAFGVLALSISKGGLPEWCRTRSSKAPPPGLVSGHIPNLDLRIQQMLQRCLSDDPKIRPDIGEVVADIEKVLLRDRHRARIVIGGKVSEIHSGSRTASPSISVSGNVASLVTIEYNGDDFVVHKIIGEVRANNNSLSVGDILPLTCVLAFRHGNNYYYATFDTSNPEYIP